MPLEAFRDPNSQYPRSLLLPASGSGANLEALVSRNLLRDEERMNPILHMAELNPNFGPNIMNTTLMERSSISRPTLATDAAIAAYLESHGIRNMEPYTSLPSTPMSFSGNSFMNVSQNDEMFPHLFQDKQKQKKRQQPGNSKGPKELCKTKPNCRASSSAKVKKERGPLTPSPKKKRVEHNQENIQQQQVVIDKILWNEFQARNTLITSMAEKYGLQNELQKPILHSALQFRGFNLPPPNQIMRTTLQDQVNLQMAFMPFLEGGICSRRLKQYLYHLRNNTHDNSISYWQKFVSEYYAPNAKKRWCFSNYEDIQLQATGVFNTKSMEAAGCCEICCLRSGKELEATFDIIPRLFKTKFESGMVDEILFVDTPRAYKYPNFLVLEYGKAIQESVYEKLRVVHEGKLRIVFRYDLKILSWEFCAQKHEEFLLRRWITPEVNQLMQACQAFQRDIQRDASFRVSSANLQTLCDTFVSAGNQLVRNTEAPLVDDLGYPKRFVRCLQIAEVMDSMKDVMNLSLETGIGPIECFNNIFFRGTNTPYQTRAQNLPSFHDQPSPRFHADIRQLSENSSMSDAGSSGLPFVTQNSSAASVRRIGQEGPSSTGHSSRAAQSSDSSRSKNPHQAAVEKLLHEMVSANRVKTVNNKYETVQKPNQLCGKRNGPFYGESSVAPSVQSNPANAASRRSNVHLSKPVSRSVTVKSEPCSPELLPEAFQSSELGFVKFEDMDV
ncbi:Probable transcriptional regulator SLK1 [Striga hermonthica]|uniref:Probable transcriptional regulator SLK1 n=1 Tax=Striga hermonthica TaxID=68872 RepID=A0A9N7NT89_STRHE|nr:Probable transcriptional regulator SLK1 [Striga hermonthica]